MSLADEVIEKHTLCVHPGQRQHCRKCNDTDTWPCDAYRLAVMVRDVEALAATWDFPPPPAIPMRHRVRGECADAILAIIRPGEKT